MLLATTGAPHERPWRLLEDRLAELPLLVCARLGRRRLYTRLAPAIIASLDGSGYARERGVDLLAACTTGRELPWLLLRTRDWVDPVLVKAGRSVASRMGALAAERVCEMTALVVDLHGRGFDDDPARGPTWAKLLATRFADAAVAQTAPRALGASPDVAAHVFARLDHFTPPAWLPTLRALAVGRKPALAGRALRVLEKAAP